MSSLGASAIPETAGLIVAAGEGHRLGAGIPKGFLQLGTSPLFLWSLRTFQGVEQIARIVLVVPADRQELARSLCQQAGLTKVAAVIPGGRTRAESVYAGLENLSSQAPELVAIHDGVRPFVSPAIIIRTLGDAQRTGAAIAARPVTDTLKEVNSDGRVVGTADRAKFWQAQTPQTFRFSTIHDAYRQARAEGWEATDDAALVEKAGGQVTVVEDDPGNFKITLPEDWTRAQALVAGPETVRIGHGYDVHRLAEGRRLMLGGVEVPHDQGLVGHSDADVVLHAIADALLGGVALGDIGTHFADNDPAFQDADSAALLAEVLRLVAEAGYRPVNVDVTIMAEQPRLALHIPAMRNRIAAILQLDAQAVSVKATTTEGLGFVGREEGIATEAVALLARVVTSEPL